jgi:hypothetical protein
MVNGDAERTIRYSLAAIGVPIALAERASA